MSVLAVALTLVLLAIVIVVVSRPLLTVRTPQGTLPGAPAGKTAESQALVRGDLEAAREAKYREIRDAELDYRTGKLSSEDYEAINGTLRAEAVDILDRLGALERETDDGQQQEQAPSPPK
jgi:hypothetical protein